MGGLAACLTCMLALRLQPRPSATREPRPRRVGVGDGRGWRRDLWLVHGPSVTGPGHACRRPSCCCCSRLTHSLPPCPFAAPRPTPRGAACPALPWPCRAAYDDVRDLHQLWPALEVLLSWDSGSGGSGVCATQAVGVGGCGGGGGAQAACRGGMCAGQGPSRWCGVTWPSGGDAAWLKSRGPCA